jgi:hypothetical protein
MKQFLAKETLVFMAIWVLLLAFGRQGLFKDPGTFWHLAIGQRILVTQQAPTGDSFSFTCAGHAWTDGQWLAECLMALIYRVAGFDGLLIITSAILALLFTWLYRRLLKAGLHFLMAGLILAMTLGASTLHFHARPNIVTIILMALSFGWLCDFETRRAAGRKLLWLIPVFVIWTNSHGGVIGGLATFLITLGGWTILWLNHGESPLETFPEVLYLWGLLLACGLTILVNPYGVELPRSWLAIMNSPVISAKIKEHAPLVQSQGSVLVIAFGVFYLGALLGTLPQRPRVTWLIPLVWFALAWSRVRHAPLFAVTAAVALADIFPRVRWARWLAARGHETFVAAPAAAERHNLTLKQLSLPVLAVCVLLTYVGLEKSISPAQGDTFVRLDPGYWPVGLLPELQDVARSRTEGSRIFNDMRMGGFLIFYAPQLRVFIDDRCELYGDDFLLAAMEAPGQVIEDWSRQYHFNLALTERGSQYHTYLRSAPHWQLVKETAAGSLYRKRSD